MFLLILLCKWHDDWARGWWFSVFTEDLRTSLFPVSSLHLCMSVTWWWGDGQDEGKLKGVRRGHSSTNSRGCLGNCKQLHGNKAGNGKRWSQASCQDHVGRDKDVMWYWGVGASSPGTGRPPPTPGVSQEWCYWTCMCLGQLCQEELGEAQSWKKEVELGGSMGTQEKDDKCWNC